MRRCDQRIRPGVRRDGWYCLGRGGQRSVGLGVSERGVQPVPQVGKYCLEIRDTCFGRHDLADVPGERGDQQIEGLGIAFLERGVENRAGFGTELRECLRGEVRVALSERRGTAATACEQRRREPARQKQRGRKSGVQPARHTRPLGREDFRLLCCGVVAAGLCPRCQGGGTAPEGTGQGDAADNDAADRAAEPADEGRTNPLGGLGSWGGGVERDWHWRREYSRYDILCQGLSAEEMDFFLGWLMALPWVLGGDAF